MADSPLSASRQTKPRASPTVTQSLRMLCSSSTMSRRMLKSSLLFEPVFIDPLFIDPARNYLQRLPHGLRNNFDKLLHAKWFFHAGRAGFAQRGHGFFVGDVAGNKDDALAEIGAMLRDPGMNLAAVDAAGRAHITDDAEERSVFEHAERVDAGVAADDGISAALERSLHVGHHSRFVFDQKNRQRVRVGCWQAHFEVPPAATPSEMVRLFPGRRTMNVAPWPP